MKWMLSSDCATRQKFWKSARLPVRRPRSRSNELGAEPTVPNASQSPPMCSEWAGFHECSVNSAGAVLISVSTIAGSNVTCCSRTVAPASS